ncbi:efflux RND transporter periplasmic adaptor subunit [Nitrosomonas supralitoralis]|nr:efflux RND transporter periplasmic adaptor subunit [Nitrosomonas supralitoralis]
MNPPIEVTFMAAEPVKMPMSLETIAQTEGAKEIEVRPRVGGILLKRLYDEGAAVEAGQPLFLIDPEPFQNALKEANALLREQSFRMLRAQSDENRQRQLLAENFVSQRAYDLAAVDLAIEEAALQAAKIRVQQAQLNLSYTTVKAPVSGVTGRSQFSEGTLVSANNSLLTTLTQLSPIWVRFSFSDNEVARIGGHLNEKNVHSVRMILPGGSEYQQDGKINFAASKIDPMLGTQQLRATFDNTEQRILPGQFVRVRVIAGEFRTVYIVPQVAVLASDLGRYVYVIDEHNAVIQRPVIADDWIGKDWIILDGLNAGDRVVVDNLIKLSPGKIVDPKLRDATSSSPVNVPSL